MLIVLDAGHWLEEPGRRCLKELDPNETREWELNSRVAERAGVLLQGYDCTVMRVDDTTGRKKVTLEARVKAANAAGADVYVSIHHNALGRKFSGSGIVVYRARVCRQASKDLQAAVYAATVERTGLKGNRSNPTPAYDFYVLKHTTMPAILIEGGFMDSVVDAPIIITEAHAEQLARGIVEGLVQVLGLQRKQTVQVELPVLQRGSKGPAVVTLQRLLEDKGHDPNGVDGSFGPGCQGALREYQRMQRLEDTGVCDGLTWTQLLTKEDT